MVVEGTVVKLTVPVVLQDVVRTKFVAEVKDAVGARFGGVEVIVGTFEGSKVFNGEVLWKAFDREAGKIIGHLMGLWGSS